MRVLPACNDADLRRRSGVGLLAAAVLALGAGGPPRPAVSEAQASAFAVRVVKLVGESRYAAAWQLLVPAHRAAAPKTMYVACESQSPVPHVASVEVLRAPAAWVRVAGLPKALAGRAVELRTTFTTPGLPPMPVRHTVHVVVSHGTPAWILRPASYSAYSAGECPG
jgi:hypothetical protein